MMRWLAYGGVWLGWLTVTVFTAGFLWTNIMERATRAAWLSCLLILGLLGLGSLGISAHVIGGIFSRVFLLMGGIGCVLVPLLLLISFGKNAPITARASPYRRTMRKRNTTASKDGNWMRSSVTIGGAKSVRGAGCACGSAPMATPRPGPTA